MISTLKKVSEILRGSVQWAVYGGVAVAIHNGAFYRNHGDVDIIIEDNEAVIKEIFRLYNLDLHFFVRGRTPRKRAMTEINGVKIEFLFLTGQNPYQIDAPGGKTFRFQLIAKSIDNFLLPVVDLPSLLCIKLKHFASLENDPELNNSEALQNQLKNQLKDLEVLETTMYRLVPHQESSDGW